MPRITCLNIFPAADGARCMPAVFVAAAFLSLVAITLIAEDGAGEKPAEARPAVAADAANGTPSVPATAAGRPAAQNDAASKPAAKRVPLNKTETVLLDAEGKRVLLKAKVVLREGLLEMLACVKQTKEHESILAVDTKAYVIHTGLLALGAKVGTPVQFVPEYRPATGQKIDVFLQWSDDKGKLHRVPAQSWIRNAIHRFYSEKMEKLPAGFKLPEDSNLRYDKMNGELLWYGPMTAAQRDELQKLSADKAYRAAIASFYKQSQSRQMEADWVFAGSGFYVDEKTGEKYYRAEDGDLICVANFPSAMLDLAIESSASGEENLLFEAYTERIPPLGTEVTIELVPVFGKK